MLGHMAYILEGVKHLQNIKSYHMKVTNVSETGETAVIEDEFIYGMITNSYSVGGFKSIAGNVFKGNIALDDGLFEVTLIKMPKNPMELNSILAALAIQNIDTETFIFKLQDRGCDRDTSLLLNLHPVGDRMSCRRLTLHAPCQIDGTAV